MSNKGPDWSSATTREYARTYADARQLSQNSIKGLGKAVKPAVRGEGVLRVRYPTRYRLSRSFG